MTDAEAERQADELRAEIVRIFEDNWVEPELNSHWPEDLADALLKKLPQLLRQAGWTMPFADGFIDGVATERDRIRQLAIRHSVTVHACLSTCHDPAHSVPFAELLDAPGQHRAEHLAIPHVDASGHPVPCWHGDAAGA